MAKKALDTRYDTCSCGRPKRKVSRTCKECQRQTQNADSDNSIHRHLLTPQWIAEFRGFFMGEGCALIVLNGQSKSPSAQLTIRLRDDDCKLLEEVQRVLGGKLLYSHAHKNPNAGGQAHWRVTN